MPTVLRDLVIERVDLVDTPANPDAHVVIAKRKGRGSMGGGDDENPMDGNSHGGGPLKRAMRRGRKMMAGVWKSDDGDQQLEEGESALVESVRNILLDDTVIDKRAAVAEALTEFQSAVLDMLPEPEKGDDIHKGDDSMPDNTTSPEAIQKAVDAAVAKALDAYKAEAEKVAKAKDEEIAKRDERIAALEGAEADRVALAKANSYEHLIGDKAPLAALFKKLGADDAKALDAVLKAQDAALGEAGLFREVGTTGTDGKGESKLMKAMKAEADRIAKARAA